MLYLGAKLPKNYEKDDGWAEKIWQEALQFLWTYLKMPFEELTFGAS